MAKFKFKNDHTAKGTAFNRTAVQATRTFKKGEVIDAETSKDKPDLAFFKDATASYSIPMYEFEPPSITVDTKKDDATSPATSGLLSAIKKNKNLIIVSVAVIAISGTIYYLMARKKATA